MAMKVKIIRGYFSNGPKLYRAGEVLDLPDDVAADVIDRAGGDIVMAESSPTPAPKPKATKKSAKKKAPVEESEEDMSLPDVDAAAAISK